MNEIKHIALFSGGKDSLVATHYAMRHFPIDFVVYLDTNSGLPQNKEYVNRICALYDWDLKVKQSPMQMSEFVKKYGFPGPSAHSWAFRYFKERQLDAIATKYDTVVFYSGVRQKESARRMRNVTGKYNLSNRWLWVSPIWNFSQEQCDEYINKYGLETNPLYDTIGRSGDCYCGAYAHRNTELAELQEHYPNHYQWLVDLENQAKNWGLNKKTQQWGWGGLSEQELRAQIAMNDEEQMMLCSNCDVGL